MKTPNKATLLAVVAYGLALFFTEMSPSFAQQPAPPSNNSGPGTVNPAPNNSGPGGTAKPNQTQPPPNGTGGPGTVNPSPNNSGPGAAPPPTNAPPTS